MQMALDGLPEAPAPDEDGPFITSVTSLVTLAACPKRYYWSAIDRLPRRPALWLKRGIEFHRSVELHNLGIIPLEDATDVSYDVVQAAPADFDGSEPSGETPAGEGEPAAPDAYGAFLESRFASDRPRFVEVPIDVKIGDGRIRGRIDAVYEPEPGTWEIVDFKSGRAGPDDARRVQLQAYAVAADDGALPVPAPDRLGVTFAFFGGGTAEEIHEPLDADWLEDARRRLGDLMEQARGDTFEPTPSPSCRSCDFVRFCPEGTAHLAER
jgi:DNA helicase-2/ATP-dependent DNA helicase PcrA